MAHHALLPLISEAKPRSARRSRELSLFVVAVIAGEVGIMVDEKRRTFFRDLIREVVRNATAAFESGQEERKREEELDAFFESYESSYALTLCYPDDILIETARMEGVAFEGRERADIVKDLLRKKGWS